MYTKFLQTTKLFLIHELAHVLILLSLGSKILGFQFQFQPSFFQMFHSGLGDLNFLNVLLLYVLCPLVISTGYMIIIKIDYRWMLYILWLLRFDFLVVLLQVV